MTAPAMASTVEALLASGKGILAADESFPTIEKRFKALNITSSERESPRLSKDAVQDGHAVRAVRRRASIDNTPLIASRKKRGLPIN